MKTCRLHQQNNPDCLLFMAGWGMGPEPFQHMAAGPLDVIMVYDYRHLADLDLRSQLSPDSRLHLLAWSMGVWAAGSLLQNYTFSSATAIGGTCRPIDDTFGIPDRVFEQTIDDFSPGVLSNFYNAMFDRPKQAQKFLDNQPDRSLEGLREELIALRAAACRMEAEDIFDCRIVTGRDRIFPARNQIRAWGRHNYRSCTLPHFPFYQWSSWSELLEFIQQ